MVASTGWEKQICALEKQKTLKQDELRGKAERSHPDPREMPQVSAPAAGRCPLRGGGIYP